MKENTALPTLYPEAKEKFELACKSADGLQIVNNFGAAFQAVTVVQLLREAMTDKVMDEVFMPLMNTKIGFLTDHTGKARGNRPPLQPYSREIVRDAIIDAVTIGLLPTGNQFNIIAERMYPTKEGYTALLRRLNVKYFIEVSYDKSQTKGFAEIPCKITYEYNGEKNSFSIVATVKKDDYSSPDQLRGKAERRAKKALYEYITGCDFGDADEESSTPVDVTYTEIKSNANQGEPIELKPRAAAQPQAVPQAQPQAAPQRPVAQPQPQPAAQPQQAEQRAQTPGF
jgi:hypothetical protein